MLSSFTPFPPSLVATGCWVHKDAQVFALKIIVAVYPVALKSHWGDNFQEVVTEHSVQNEILLVETAWVRF